MAMCVSLSGGVTMTRSLPVVIDQPAGTVNFAPPGVTRGVSAVTSSGADFVPAACGAAGGVEGKTPRAAVIISARNAIRALRHKTVRDRAVRQRRVRSMDMGDSASKLGNSDAGNCEPTIHAASPACKTRPRFADRPFIELVAGYAGA